MPIFDVLLPNPQCAIQGRETFSAKSLAFQAAKRNEGFGVPDMLQ